MSFWMTGEENGRRTLTLGGGGDVLVPMILLGLAASLGVFNPVPSGALLTTGFFCLLVAKASLFRRGIWTSWGTRRMSRGYARLYKVGYALIGLGFALGLLFIKLAP